MELDINKTLKKSLKRGFLQGSYRKIAAKSGGCVHTQGKFILKISSCETKRSKMFVRKCADNTLHLRYFNCHHQHAMIVCPNDKRKNTIRIYFYHLLNVIRKIPKFNLYSRKIMSYFDCWCYYRTSIIFILALEFLHMQIRMSVPQVVFIDCFSSSSTTSCVKFAAASDRRSQKFPYVCIYAHQHNDAHNLSHSKGTSIFINCVAQ